MKAFVYKNYLFISILIIFVTLSLFLVGHYDFSSDSSLYSIRAFGWTDYIGGGQKGPVEWLGHSTWWSGLSFQDAPPVVFGLEYIFFRVLGPATSSVQILFLLSGVLTFISIFFCIKKIRDDETALWSASAFAVSSLALWSSLNGNLEGVETLFVLLNFLMTALYIKYSKSKYLYSAVVFMGLAVMSKYTAVFIIPSFLTTIYLRHKSNKTKEILSKYFLSIILFLVIISPTVTYNYYLYKLRGNFDTALSAMVGMNNELGRGISFNFVGNSFEILQTLFQTGSFPYIISGIFGFIWLARKSQNKQTDVFEDSLIVYVSLLFIMLGFMGGGVRWLPLFTPFISIIIGLLIVQVKEIFKSKMIVYFAIGVLLFEFMYSVNTNVLTYPVGRVKVFSSAIRNSSLGFNELEKYLNTELAPLPEIYRAQKQEDLRVIAPSVNDNSTKSVMYDGRINWFAKSWYLEKYFIYYKIKVFTFDNSWIRNNLFPKNSIENSSLWGSGKVVYFVKAENPRVMNPDHEDVLNGKLEAFSRELDSKKIPFALINNRYGEVAFKVYKISF